MKMTNSSFPGAVLFSESLSCVSTQNCCPFCYKEITTTGWLYHDGKTWFLGFACKKGEQSGEINDKLMDFIKPVLQQNLNGESIKKFPPLLLPSPDYNENKHRQVIINNLNKLSKLLNEQCGIHTFSLVQVAPHYWQLFGDAQWASSRYDPLYGPRVSIRYSEPGMATGFTLETPSPSSDPGVWPWLKTETSVCELTEKALVLAIIEKYPFAKDIFDHS
jgi:hypothetical protein